MNFSWGIIDHLKKYHTGSGKAVSIINLYRNVGAPGCCLRELQLMIWRLILEDAPISVSPQSQIYWDPSGESRIKNDAMS